MAFFLVFIATLSAIYFPGAAIIDAIDAGKITARKVGGLTFVKIGRFGFSFYVSKRA